MKFTFFLFTCHVLYSMCMFCKGYYNRHRLKKKHVKYVFNIGVKLRNSMNSLN